MRRQWSTPREKMVRRALGEELKRDVEIRKSQRADQNRMIKEHQAHLKKLFGPPMAPAEQILQVIEKHASRLNRRNKEADQESRQMDDVLNQKIYRQASKSALNALGIVNPAIRKSVSANLLKIANYNPLSGGPIDLQNPKEVELERMRRILADMIDKIGKPRTILLEKLFTRYQLKLNDEYWKTLDKEIQHSRKRR